MKFDISTPSDAIRKDLKRRRFTFWVSLVVGILAIGGVPPLGIFSLILAFISFKGMKKDKALLGDQEKAAAADARQRAEREAKIRAELEAEEKERQEFLDTHELVRELHTKVAGVTFRNDDGTSRQEILESYCFSGQHVDLQEFTYKGKPAFAVFADGDQIGNIPAETAQALHDMPDDWVIDAEIDEVTGGGEGMKYGCNLRLLLYRKK